MRVGLDGTPAEALNDGLRQFVGHRQGRGGSGCGRDRIWASVPQVYLGGTHPGVRQVGVW